MYCINCKYKILRIKPYYKCSICMNYIICYNCIDKIEKDHKHPFIRYFNPDEEDISTTTSLPPAPAPIVPSINNNSDRLATYMGESMNGRNGYMPSTFMARNINGRNNYERPATRMAISENGKNGFNFWKNNK